MKEGRVWRGGVKEGEGVKEGRVSRRGGCQGGQGVKEGRVSRREGSIFYQSLTKYNNWCIIGHHAVKCYEMTIVLNRAMITVWCCNTLRQLGNSQLRGKQLST